MIIAFNLLLLEYSEQFDLQLIACFYIMISETFTNFMFCYQSENISSAMTRVSDIFYESMWYYLPICQQKMIILTIAGSQQDFELDGFGLISCSLSTFWQVICRLLSEIKIKSPKIHVVHFADSENYFIVFFVVSEHQMSRSMGTRRRIDIN